MDLSRTATVWRRDGFVVLPGYLDGPELQAAQQDLAAAFPSAEEYCAVFGEGATGFTSAMGSAGSLLSCGAASRQPNGDRDARYNYQPAHDRSRPVTKV